MKLSFIIYFLLVVFNAIGQKNDSHENFGGASYYHDMFHGRETSNGEIYNKDDFTSAHRKYPFNTILLVTNKKNNRSVVVRVNDRGPFKRSRVIDLSLAAAKKIGMVSFGVVQVRIKALNFLNPDIMNDDLMKDGEVWDCYGNRKKLSNTVIFLWSTDSWKHAFYMASCLSLEYKISSILVKVSGPSKNRMYDLFVSELNSENELPKLVTLFKSDGFFNARILQNASQGDEPRDDQSTK